MKNKKGLFFVLYSLIAGVVDVIFPNIEKSIKEVKSEFYDDPPQLHVNWVRVISAAATFVLLILNFFRIVKLEEVIQVLELLKK